MPQSVLVADPDDRAAVAFGSALRGTEFSFAGSVTNGKALLDAVFSVNPWAVALDLALPDHPAAPNLGWAATVPQLKEIAPQVRPLITFRPEMVGLVPGALRSGARAFVEKPYLREEVLAALRHAASDQPALRYYNRSRRVARSLTIRYKSIGGGNTTVTRVGVSLNISETGILASTPERLPARSVVMVDLELPDRSTLRCRGQVVREIASPGAAPEYGIALFEMEPANRLRLRDFIARVLNGDAGPAGDPKRFASAASR